MKRFFNYSCGLAVLLGLFYSCAVKKYMPDDELLYRGGEVELKDSTISKKGKSMVEDRLEGLLYPDPNTKFLGTYPGLHYYYKNQQKHPGFLNKFLYKKIGEEPSYLSQVDLDNTEELMQNRLENNGFFYSSISSSVKKDSSQRTARIKYDVEAGKPYRLANYEIDRDSLDSLSVFKPIKASLAQSDIEKGNRYNLDAFKNERDRIGKYLKNRGYYNFDSSFLLFKADTNQHKDRKFDLYLDLKKGVPEKSKDPYVLDSVEVFVNQSPEGKKGTQDTTRIGETDFIQSKTFFKPWQLKPFVLLEPGQKYDPERSKNTSRRLSNIGTYKFVNIKYEETDSVPDKHGNRHLKSEISLSPLTRNSIQAELKGLTKSNNFTGPGLGLTYTNRNIFKGGENFKAEADVGYEKQFSSGDNEGSRSLHLGLKASLLFPRLIFPGDFEKNFEYSIPKTKISAGMDFLDRSQLYSLTSFSTSFGYIWDQNRFVTHKLDPIKVDYVKLSHTSSRFESILDDNPFLRRSFEQQFIAGTQYSFTYDELNDSHKKGRVHFNFKFDIAGDLVDLFGKRHGADQSKTFLGLKYAQYVKGDVDFSYHYHLTESGHSLVGHLFAGMGFSHGNSKSLPFVKQYFAGGPYSIRAFRIRGLGPGTYQPEPGRDSYYDQAGDIRLEANLEYRFPIFSIFKGAVFADAGNIWLQRKNEALPGGKFSSDFYKELGVGAGFGLRIDVQGFVIRFDLASPLHRPNGNWDFEYSSPTFNFGIGYPF